MVGGALPLPRSGELPIRQDAIGVNTIDTDVTSAAYDIAP